MKIHLLFLLNSSIYKVFEVQNEIGWKKVWEYNILKNALYRIAELNMPIVRVRKVMSSSCIVILVIPQELFIANLLLYLNNTNQGATLYVKILTFYIYSQPSGCDVQKTILVFTRVQIFLPFLVLSVNYKNNFMAPQETLVLSHFYPSDV